jgi:signal transduction histidine kinase
VKRPNSDFEILILAPTGEDGKAAVEVLKAHQLEARSFSDMNDLCRRLNTYAGAILLAEEALSLESSGQLKEVLSVQEPWSSIPIILMTSEFEKILSAEKILEILGTSGSLSILERPFKILTLISAVRVALGSRLRQYEVSELLQEQIKALKQRDEFLSIASHELKTPLTSLKIQVQLRKKLFEKGDPGVYEPENVMALVNMTDKQVNRLTRLVDDMLDITRIQSGKLTLNIEAVDFHQLILDVGQNFKEQYQAARCDLVLNVDDNLFVAGDIYRLEQVIANLLSNALKYGNGCPVKVRAKSEGDQVVLTVQDEGMGIAEENHARIFERFERAVSASSIGGLGLGLYITRQIVELHRGKITLQSSLGKGSTFTITLPVNK